MNMRTIGIGVLVLIVIALAGWFFFFKQPSTPVGPGNTNPFASTTSPGITPGAPTISVTATDGSVYQVPNFTEGKKADVLPAGTYYHLTNNQDTQGDQAQFEIEYGTDNSVTIVLIKEPLKDARLAAETALRSFFPLSDSQLCSLDVSVGVPASVSDVYGGNSLGLSFCPGAVKLP